MHGLTRKKVERFGEVYGFEGPVERIFEHYVVSVYLYRYLNDDPQQIEGVVIGGGNDEGIDAAAVIVNGQLVTEPSEIDDLIEGNSSNTAKVIFIQAKTSEKYDSKLIAKFLHGVECVSSAALASSEDADLPPALADVADMIGTLAGHMDSFESTRIPCELLYVTTSSTQGEEAKKERQVLNALARINGLELYQDGLDVELEGFNQLAEKQKERQGPHRVKFNFNKRVTIPDDDVDEVQEAYIGLLTAKDVLQLLLNEGEIRPGIFDENVRLDLGSKNPVNREIAKTLDSAQRTEFPFLNNGLTIVARELENSGDRFYASGYQIINGGQTSNQIIRWATRPEVGADSELLEKVWVPVKLIAAERSDVRRKAAVATNLQSAIGSVDIQSSLPKAQEVEEFFAQSGSDGLRYERQAREKELTFTKTRVVNTSELDRAVASVVFGESSQAIGSPKELEAETSYIWGDYPAEMYYYAAFVIYRVDRFIARNPSYAVLKAARYHIGMMVSAMVIPDLVAIFEQPKSSSNKLKLPSESKFTGLHSGGDLYGKIEKAIEEAAAIVAERYADVLETGRSLRKDDVRSNTQQVELLNIAKSKSS